MKVGDTVPVTLAGHAVAQARVSEMSDGKAVLIIPATAVTMAVRTELDAAPPEPKETETIITGVDRPEDAAAQGAEPVESPSAISVGQTDNVAAEPNAAEPQTNEAQSAESQVAAAPVVETQSTESAPVESTSEPTSE